MSYDNHDYRVFVLILPDVIEFALLLVCGILCDLMLYSSNNLTTPLCPDLAATLRAFLPHASD